MAAERIAKRRRLSPPDDTQSSVPGFAKWNIEQDYEQRPRKSKKDKAKGDKLLVKTAGGEWEENERLKAIPKPVKDDDADSFLASGSDGGGADSGAADVESAPAQQLPPKEQVRQAKEELARLAGQIISDPEENIAHLTQLAAIAESSNATVKKLALGTQLAVYKDIIPGYRIRQQSKEDMAAKLSKD
ncbi:hypothetical protein LTR53_018596, partial [Teratosphaeriaceae sp. CCFEE 6253]